MKDQRFEFRVRTSFTLIELLVVVAILTVLVAVLLPALTAARDRAKTITCQNNLRQTGTAAQGYLMDSADWFPPGAYSYPGNINGALWKVLLAPYLGLKQKGVWISDNWTPIFACPASFGAVSDWRSHYIGYRIMYHSGRGSNLGVSGFDGRNGDPVCEPISAVRRPLDRVIWVTEGHPEVGALYGWDPFFWWARWDHFDFRHRGTAVIVWMDWHISLGVFTWSDFAIF